MDKTFGQELIDSAKEALAFVDGDTSIDDFVVHLPAEIDTRKIRRRLSMSQADFAEVFGFNMRTLQEWEQGRSMPTGAIRSYLMVISKQADVVKQALI